MSQLPKPVANAGNQKPLTSSGKVTSTTLVSSLGALAVAKLIAQGLLEETMSEESLQMAHEKRNAEDARNGNLILPTGNASEPRTDTNHGASLASPQPTEDTTGAN